LRNDLGEILLQQGAINEDQLREALALIENRSLPLSRALVSTGAADERTVARALARQAHLPFVDLEGKTPPGRLTGLVDSVVAWEQEALPVSEKNGALVVAVSDPARVMVADTLHFLLDRPVSVALAAPAALRKAMERAYGSPAESRQAQEEPGEELESPVVRLVNQIFQEAVAARASDIHIEPFSKTVRIRIRVDGELRTLAEHPLDLHPALLSHIKVQAGLDIAEKRKPQDGRFEHVLGKRVLDVRASILPTNHGESCVMRLLDREANLLSLEDLGMSPAALEWFRRLIQRPNGIFLVTGPTGSGKTTTLYAALQTINHADRKILTVEDPVEYRIRGINQVQVHPRIGLGFARVLRSFLRQAPNVVLVGEIRDRETAETAIQASLTGHLVFSTLHTNDAPSAVTRLLDMGVAPFLLGASLQGVLAQRLVRRLCPDCSRMEPATPFECRLLDLPAGTSLVHAHGCRKCNRSGFRGRIGVFEWLDLDEELRQVLFRAQDPGAFRQAASKSPRWVPLFRDAAEKALKGLTTVQEVLRATRMESSQLPSEKESSGSDSVPESGSSQDDSPNATENIKKELS